MSASPKKRLDRGDIPEHCRAAFDLCDTFGFKPEFDHDYKTPDHNRRVQVRAEKHVAPHAEVNKYGDAMRRGDKFPPLVITRDGFLVDGATRAAAATKIKYATLPTLILDEDYEGSSQQVIQRLIGLGAAFNLRNGKGIDKGELRNAIERFSDNRNYDATRLAALLGVTESIVRNTLAAKRARERGTRLDVATDQLSSTQLRTIGRGEKTMNDGPMRELLTLTDEANLSGKEISGLMKAMRIAKSDDKAIEVVEHEREARREQIALRKATGGKTIAPHSAKLRQHLGFVQKFMDGNAHEAVERNPAMAKEHLRAVENSVAALQQIADFQRQFDAGNTV